MRSTRYATLTVYGAKVQFNGIAPFSPVYVPNDVSTVNSQLGVFASLVPNAGEYPKVGCFGIGIRGFYPLTDVTPVILQPFKPKATNTNLHTPIPFRVVPVDEDLSIEERALYRIRERRTIGGNDYFLYWLKVVEFDISEVVVQRISPSGVPEPYIPSPEELQNSPSQADIITNTTQVDSISTSFSFKITVTHEEVMEAINVMYGGDDARAVISELGIYTGVDRVVAGADGNGDPLNYTESIYTQLMYHRCNSGDNMSQEGKVIENTITMKDGNVVLRA